MGVGVAFKMDPSLSWGDVAMTVGLLVSGVLAFAALETEISLNKERIANIGASTTAVQSELQRHVEAEREAREALRQELRMELKEINSKLDKLIEREVIRNDGGGRR